MLSIMLLNTDGADNICASDSEHYSGFSLAEAPELVVTYWFQEEDKREQRYRELWIPVTKNE